MVPIISTQELSGLLHSPQLRIVDCRFDLANPAWGKEDYQKGHIAGAVFADMNNDLASKITPTSGRHPLPDAATFVEKLAQWGITPEHKVVVYDTTNGGYAGRLWWMLRAVGHADVQLLDGGYLKWQRENQSIETGWTVVQPTQPKYPARFDPSLSISAQDVLSAVQGSNLLLVDARAPERFQGLAEPIDAVAGHIPGAANRFYGLNLSADGTFKPADQLRQEFSALMKDTPANQTVVYCGSGVTSCHHLIALEIAGMPGARIYIGSWSEWLRDPTRPRAAGE